MCVEILLLLLYWEADNFCVFSGFLLFVLVESLPEKRGISGNKPILHNTREKAIQVVMRIRLSNRVLLLLLLSSVWSLVVVFYLSNSMSGGTDSSMDFTARNESSRTRTVFLPQNSTTPMEVEEFLNKTATS